MCGHQRGVSGLRLAVFTFLLACNEATSCMTSAADAPTATLTDLPAWDMHLIDNEYYNHNSLSPGDVNGDGLDDYAVIHEMSTGGYYTILLHPGRGGDPRRPWQKAIVGTGKNVEHSVFGDFDGDGAMDIAGADGLVKGIGAGLKMLWGPGKSRVTDRAAWTDGGYFPVTVGRGHYLWVQAMDVNGDGALDLVAGGRVQGTHGLENQEGKRTAGIVWLEAPTERAERRDLSKWTLHDIDPESKGGHGFIFADIDGDGDLDIVNCNADWNTFDHEEAVVWYENPGHGTAEQRAAQRRPWRLHTVYRGGEFYSKAQVAAGDLNGDGKLDLCVQTVDHLYVFLQGTTPDDWTHLPVRKHEVARWLPRPLKLVDLDGNGRLDVVGALIHDEKGALPAGKAAVFVMSFSGAAPTTDNWTTRVIKWSDGADTGQKFRGEKWDTLDFADIDGDGDLDIIANAEEHYDLQRRTIVGVVWFENPARP
jgi:hypothetical protein